MCRIWFRSLDLSTRITERAPELATLSWEINDVCHTYVNAYGAKRERKYKTHGPLWEEYLRLSIAKIQRYVCMMCGLSSFIGCFPLSPKCFCCSDCRSFINDKRRMLSPEQRTFKFYRTFTAVNVDCRLEDQALLAHVKAGDDAWYTSSPKLGSIPATSARALRFCGPHDHSSSICSVNLHFLDLEVLISTLTTKRFAKRKVDAAPNWTFRFRCLTITKHWIFSAR